MGRPKLMTDDDVLDAIRATTAYRIVAVPPSIETVRRHLGVASTRTIFRYLQSLSDRGLIHSQQGRAGIELTEHGCK